MKKKVILVLGNLGMAGHVIQRYFENTNKYTVIGLNRKDLDMTDYIKLEQKLLLYNPDIVINCVGLLNNPHSIQDYADVNIVLPRMLDYLSKQEGHKFKLIHISSNCVFNDESNDAYSIPNAQDWYGQSKAFGEIDNDKNLTIRTSIIGPELKENGIGLFHKFITDENFINGFTNVYWNGVTTLELAKYIEDAMDFKTGIVNYHTFNVISKHDLLQIINEVFDLNKKLNKKKNYDAHQALLIGDATDLSFEEQLMELKQFMIENKDLYKNIYKTME